jgi:hypothetical protein
MIRFILAFILLVLPSAAQAGDLVLKDLKAQNGVQLSADELNQLLPNAKVTSYFSGSTRTWKNEPGGSFTALSDFRRSMKPGMAQATGQGTWHVGKDGAYCVSIDWPQRSEKWCRYLFKVGGKYYGVKSIDDESAIAHEFEFSK